jgi:hypothetical protein
MADKWAPMHANGVTGKTEADRDNHQRHLRQRNPDAVKLLRRNRIRLRDRHLIAVRQHSLAGSYLDKEEKAERVHFGLETILGPLQKPTMTRIIDFFKQDRAYIERRLAEGRVEDMPEETDKSEATAFSINLDEELENLSST